MTFRRSAESRRWILGFAAALPLLALAYAALIALYAPPAPESEQPLRLSQQLAGQPPVISALLILIALWAALAIVREALAEVTIDDTGLTARYGPRPVRIEWDKVVQVDFKLRNSSYLMVGSQGERVEVQLGWVPLEQRRELLEALHARTAEVWRRQQADIQEYGVRQGRDALHWTFLKFVGAVLAVALLYMLLNEHSKGGHYANLVPAMMALVAGWILLALVIGMYASWPLEFTATTIIERRPFHPRTVDLAAVEQVVIERDELPYGRAERLYLLGDGPRIIIPSSLVWYPLIRELVLAGASRAEVLVIGDPAPDALEQLGSMGTVA